jgi:hypothetical protein
MGAWAGPLFVLTETFGLPLCLASSSCLCWNFLWFLHPGFLAGLQ